MAEIVNLRRLRKAKSRAEREAQAAENRARHGRPKSESNERHRQTMVNQRKIDGKKLD